MQNIFCTHTDLVKGFSKTIYEFGNVCKKDTSGVTCKEGTCIHLFKKVKFNKKLGPLKKMVIMSLRTYYYKTKKLVKKCWYKKVLYLYLIAYYKYFTVVFTSNYCLPYD